MPSLQFSQGAEYGSLVEQLHMIRLEVMATHGDGDVGRLQEVEKVQNEVSSLERQKDELK